MLTIFQQYTDWYRISRREVERRGGIGLFGHHSSLGAALQSAYPEFAWDMPAFKGNAAANKLQTPMPKGYWQDNQNLSKALDHAKELLGIKQVLTDYFMKFVCNRKSLGRGLVLGCAHRFERIRIPFIVHAKPIHTTSQREVPRTSVGEDSSSSRALCSAETTRKSC